MPRFAVLLAIVLLAAPRALPASAAPPLCFGVPATIYGKSGTITGTGGFDVIVGSPGPDTIRAGKGQDIVCGGDGDDRIFGDDGTDLLWGEAGTDIVDGGHGDDLVDGESWDDPCTDAAADRLTGGSGDDALSDSCGANQASGGTGRDIGHVTGTFDAGPGNDNLSEIIFYLPVIETFTIGFGYAVIAEETCSGCRDGRASGGSGNDLVSVLGGIADGGAGDDVLDGFRTGDTMLGGAGADRLTNFFGVAGIQLDGGSGTDSCDLNGATPDTVRRCEVIVP